MKLPRNISGAEIVAGLRRLGYEVTRQKSHVYMTTQRNGEHHVAIPMHNPVKVGTLAGIVSSVAEHLSIGRDELLEQMRL